MGAEFIRNFRLKITCHDNSDRDIFTNGDDASISAITSAEKEMKIGTFVLV